MSSIPSSSGEAVVDGRALVHGRPRAQGNCRGKHRGWFWSRWNQGLWLAFGLGTILIGGLAGVGSRDVASMIAAEAGGYLAMLLVGDRPLLNPLQFSCLLFIAWFLVGPVVCAGQELLLGEVSEAKMAFIDGAPALWIVAVGLPLFSLGSAQTLRRVSRTWHGLALAANGRTYRVRTLVALGFVGMLLPTLAFAFGWAIQVNSLGGSETRNIWGGLLLFGGALYPCFLSSAALSLSGAAGKARIAERISCGGLLALALCYSIFSGWKGSIAGIGAVFIVYLVSRRQRPPFAVIAVFLLVFLALIEPFVYSARILLQEEGVRTTAERREVILRYARSDFRPSSTFGAARLKSLFRGISSYAGQISRRSGPLHGYGFDTDTIVWGLESEIPRVLDSGKRATLVGNFYARTVGVDLGIESPDTINSVAMSTPFDFVANYGWFVGILSFGLLGCLVAAVSGLVLGTSRMHLHPLNAMFCLTALSLEGQLEHFLLEWRSALFAAVLVAVAQRCFRLRL